jgi:phosphogluconate dehydratase
VNHFHAAGGMAFLIRELLGAGLLHERCPTVAGAGPRRYPSSLPGRRRAGLARGAARQPATTDGAAPAPTTRSADRRPARADGNLGRAVIKTSAVKPEHR